MKHTTFDYSISEEGIIYLHFKLFKKLDGTEEEDRESVHHHRASMDTSLSPEFVEPYLELVGDHVESFGGTRLTPDQVQELKQVFIEVGKHK